MAESDTDNSSSNPQPQKPSVIVIGSGMAGVAAARTLSDDASFNVTVLESRDRIGGRVHTDYSLGFPVDLGASWMHGASEDNPLYTVVAQLGQELYRTSKDDSILYDHDLQSYALYDLKGNKIHDDLVKEVGEMFEKILEETEILRKECAEDIPISQAISMVVERKPELTLGGDHHKVLQWFLCRMEGWFAADADTISLKSWDQETLVEGGHGIMVEGYLPVVKHLAEGLDIRLNHRVTKVERWGDGSVTVTVEDGTNFDADAAIVTVPLGVLKSNRIAFEPRLPEWKEEAIEGIGIGIENKIVLHFDNVFWPDKEFLGVVAKTTYKCSYFLNLYKATDYPVLVYMPAGKLARDIARLSDKEAADFAFEKLKKILPEASEPVGYLVSHWGSDENTLGSYTYDVVGQPHELYKSLRTPVDNLFFAGEATSFKYPGSVHGAYATGVKAAKKCRMRLLDPVFREELPVANVPDLWISRDDEVEE